MAWQNWSAVFKKHHQLILFCSLNFLALATLCKCTTQGGGHSSSAARNSMVKHAPVYCFHPGTEKTSLGTTFSKSLFLSCITGSLSAHICDYMSEKLDHKPIPVLQPIPDFHHLFAFLSQPEQLSDWPTHVSENIFPFPCAFPAPHPYKLYPLTDSQTIQRLPQQRAEWEPILRGAKLQSTVARTSPNSSEDLKVSELIKVLLCLQVFCFPGASYQVPLGFLCYQSFLPVSGFEQIKRMHLVMTLIPSPSAEVGSMLAILPLSDNKGYSDFFQTVSDPYPPIAS